MKVELLWLDRWLIDYIVWREAGAKENGKRGCSVPVRAAEVMWALFSCCGGRAGAGARLMRQDG